MSDLSEHERTELLRGITEALDRALVGRSEVVRSALSKAMDAENEITELRAAVRDLAEAMPPLMSSEAIHLYIGGCPDETQPEASDPECERCQLEQAARQVLDRHASTIQACRENPDA